MLCARAYSEVKRTCMLPSCAPTAPVIGAAAAPAAFAVGGDTMSVALAGDLLIGKGRRSQDTRGEAHDTV
jgi:hypothetical protein